MDPLTALSLAGTVVQFVEFGTKILNGSRQCYRSASGAILVNDELELVTRDLLELTFKLGRPLFPDTVSPSAGQLEEYRDLEALCSRCRVVADKLLVRLNGLKVQGKQQAWKSFQHAVKAAWAQKEVESLCKTLSDFRRSLEMHVLSNLRSTTNLAALQHSKRFDYLDERTQNILVALLDNRDAHANDFKVQTIAVAQMLNRTEAVLTSQHDQTRAMIIDAMQVAELLVKMREEYGTHDQRENLDTLRKDEEKLEKSVENRILDTLYFKTIYDRQEEIEEAHGKTFAWLFEPDASRLLGKNNFVEWLRSSHGTYWISGKAGSGKSTLLRYICESKETKESLRAWAGSTPLAICQFFFWNSGTIEQRSQAGLLRSLLYDVLSKQRNLIPIVLPSIWAQLYNDAIEPVRHLKTDLLSEKRLVQAFKALERQETIPLKLCFFIDGLDEYEGDPADMVDLFSHMVSSKNIKVCLSSRPLVAFDVFKSSTNIRLQDLTREDIRLYVADKLHDNKRFQQLALQEIQSAPALVQDIVTKADGVFLWVKLVVRSILIGLGNRDDISDLQTRLKELPSDLEALFHDMLTRRIEPFYQKKAASLFQMVRASRERNDQLEQFDEETLPLTLLALSFADDKDPDLAMEFPIRPLNELELSVRCNTMEDRLKNACAGLLEVQGAVDGDQDVSRLDIAKLDGKVQYLHRTVKDYLEQRIVWETIVRKTEGADFNPNVSLLKSSLFQVKTMTFNEAFVPDEVWRVITLALEYSRQVELSELSTYLPLLDQIDFVMGWILQQMGQTYPGHWARFYLPGDERPFEWGDTITALAVEYGLCSYLDYKCRQSSDTITGKFGRPLLDYAVSQTPRKQRYPIYPPVVKILLQHGANPNLQYNSTTPWENAIAFAYSLQFEGTESGWGTWGLFGEKGKPDRDEVLSLLSLFKHFVEHGADLNGSCIVRAGYEKPNERQPVLFIVKDVFVRWYPEDSAELVDILKTRGASEELVSDLAIYRAMAWNTMKRVRLKLW